MARIGLELTKRDMIILLSAVDEAMVKASRLYLRTQRMTKILASVDPEVDSWNAEMLDTYEMRFNRLHFIHGKISDALVLEEQEAARCKG